MKQILESQQTPHSSPVRIWEQIDCVITALQCIALTKPLCPLITQHSSTYLLLTELVCKTLKQFTQSLHILSPGGCSPLMHQVQKQLMCPLVAWREGLEFSQVIKSSNLSLFNCWKSSNKDKGIFIIKSYNIKWYTYALCSQNWVSKHLNELNCNKVLQSW